MADRLEARAGSWHDERDVRSGEKSVAEPFPVARGFIANRAGSRTGVDGGDLATDRTCSRVYRSPVRREVVWLRITFHGATRQITGSAHLLEIGPHRLL